MLPGVAATPDQARAYADVVELAALGPREATGDAFFAAAALVETRFTTLGFAVRRQDFPTPAGVSWGVPVQAGTSTNVIAAQPGFASDAPYVIIGAHLDTVPQAPGAEDNASGVAALLELARLSAGAPPSLPVIFVAFGSEEPRAAPTSDHSYHHYGSRAYVAAMTESERANLVGMISLDRVGVGDAVPVSWAGIGPTELRDELVAAATARSVPVIAAPPTTTSDHLSFEMAGMTSARVGSTPYAGYHSAQDTADVVSPDQLGRVITMVWGALLDMTP